MERICTRAESLFHQGLPFLIEGASGAGKSAIITALLNSVDPSTPSAVCIDCATLSDSADDQLYFKTLLEQARAIESWSNLQKNISTLIFDNVDELPQFAQAGLRNLLSEFEFKESLRSETSKLRIIATCRYKLVRSVGKNGFRDDLYYLLTNAVIRVPELRQREHLELLIQAIANRIAGQQVSITTEARVALAGYVWPGNVRQLRSVLQQALLEGNGHRVSLADLSSTIVCETSSRSIAADKAHDGQGVKIIYNEKTQLLDALHSAQWNISRAARNLGIARATIHRKMKRYGIARPESM